MTSTHDFAYTPATELAELIRSRQASVAEVADAFIARVEAVNPALNAIIYFDPEQIRRDAAELDRSLADGGPLGPLHGVPYTIKDLTSVAGIPHTSGLKPFKDNIGTVDATLVTRLRAAGGLFGGKTNTPELGYYGGTDNHLFGPTQNPWKHGYSAGGSSGGAAAAVAAGLGPIADGSDGAGSIRIPSALCGVVGLKPTTGVMPAPGPFIDWAYNGPITRTVTDNALMLDVMSGHDQLSTPSVKLTGPPFASDLNRDLRGLRVAWSADLGLGVHVDPEVVQVAHSMVEALAELGAEVVEASPGWGAPSKAMWHAMWIPAYGGFGANLKAAGIDIVNNDDIDANLLEIFREATGVSVLDYAAANGARGAMWAKWREFMADYDVLVSPTLASATFPLTQFAPSWLAGTSVREQILDWLLTYPYNMMNNPAITIPGGFTSDGRPVGFQIAGSHWQDNLLLQVAHALEQARPWADKYPSL